MEVEKKLDFLNKRYKKGKKSIIIGFETQLIMKLVTCFGPFPEIDNIQNNV